MLHSIEDLNGALGEYFPSILRRAKTDDDIKTAISSGLQALEGGSISWARLNQIMHLCSEAGMSEGFYSYYFLIAPLKHPYKVEYVFSDEPYSPPENAVEIQSLKQLKWGVRRFIYDSMLRWGNFRQAYRDLRHKSLSELKDFFSSKRMNEGLLIKRGKVLNPTKIPVDDRYLISENACQSYAQKERVEDVEHVKIIIEAFEELKNENIALTSENLKERAQYKATEKNVLGLLNLLYQDAHKPIKTTADLIALYSDQRKAFKNARNTALVNTRTYLSMCSDLDVYVATSMRTRNDFFEMAKTCEKIFNDERLTKYNTRYFDPTLSATQYHEDKGIIECLMVKTCKALLYFAQEKESLGKVSEFAMALSLGKPVIVLCPSGAQGDEIYRFYIDRHPLLRLIEFDSGIVNGAIITQKVEDVIILLERIFSNRMEWDLHKKQNTDAYYLLKERLTQSTVRIITDDQLLTETFWNNYHNEC